MEAFEIQSFTRSADLAQEISKRLDLKSREGFSLFVKIGDKAYSIPEHEFIFDFISELMLWLKQNMPTRSTETQINCQYQLYFMKKLWLNALPGKDRNADIIFYYPQEVPKYLSGYYKVDKELALKMAALIYLAEYGNTLIPLQRIHDVLPHVLPEDVVPLMKSHDWKTQIINQVKKLIELNINDIQAKQSFLQEIANQQTFGSTFFLIKQTNDQNLPETILIAINRNGFHIIDPCSKVIVTKFYKVIDV